MTPQHHLPADIERTSLSIITAELDAMGLTPPPETAAVVKRVIHTTADFDYARNLRFTPGAVAAGVAALQAAAPIVTDTNMALSGITKPGLARLGGTALCYMADPEVAALAKANGTTRAVASMQRAAAEHPGAILAVGNAPTALLTIADLIETAGLRPALVIGVPVGFVNVVESKEICGKAPALKIIWTIGRKTILVHIIRNLILAVFRKISRHRRVICKVPPISVARISSWGILCRNLCCHRPESVIAAFICHAIIYSLSLVCPIYLIPKLSEDMVTKDGAVVKLIRCNVLFLWV